MNVTPIMNDVPDENDIIGIELFLYAIGLLLAPFITFYGAKNFNRLIFMISTITTWFFAYYALLDTSNIQDDHRILIILCSGLVVGCISVCLTWTFLYFLTFIVTSITFNVINLIMSKYIFNMNEDNAFVLLVFAIIFSYILLQRYRNDIEIYLTSIFGAYYFISSLDFYGYHYQLWHHLSLALDVDEPSFFTNPIMNEKFYIFVLIWALLVMCGIRFQYKDKSRYNPSAYHEIVQNHHHHTVLVTPPVAPVTYVAPQPVAYVASQPVAPVTYVAPQSSIY